MRDDIDIGCRKCLNNGRIFKKIELMELCPNCNGTGYDDWVSKAMRKRSMSVERCIAQHNIQILTMELFNEYKKFGLSIEITTKPQNGPYNYIIKGKKMEV